MSVINNVKPAFLQGFRITYAQDGITRLESPVKIKGIVGHLGNGQISHSSVLELGSSYGYMVKFSVIDSVWFKRLNRFMNQCLQGGRLVFEYGDEKINCQLLSLPSGAQEGRTDIEITLIQVD